MSANSGWKGRQAAGPNHRSQFKVSGTGGLSFGLGGRDAATSWLDKVRKEIKH